MRAFGLILAVSLCAAPAMGAVYKWVDAQGVTHYSEVPPAAQEAKQLSVPSGQGSAADAPAGRKDGEAPKSAAAPQPAGPQDDESRRRKKYCDEARAELRSLEAPGRVFRVGDDGRKVLLSGEEREAEIAAASKLEKENCEPGTQPPAVNP